MSKVFLIYRITCTPTGEKYIGVTCQALYRRWSYHVTSKYSRARLLANRISEYGRDAFLVGPVACALSQEHASDLERLLIAQENTKTPGGLNLTSGGVGNGILDPSEETRRRIGNASRGRRHTPETIAKMSAAKMGHPVSAETRAKIAAKNREYKPTPDARARSAAALRSRSPEVLARIADSVRRSWIARRAVKAV